MVDICAAICAQQCIHAAAGSVSQLVAIHRQLAHVSLPCAYAGGDSVQRIAVAVCFHLPAARGHVARPCGIVCGD